jgi:PST family polysaccharide transporter
MLFPVWFFQGMERMKYITYINVLSKLAFTIAIFVFVQEESDIYLVPLFTSIGFIFAGIISIIIIKEKFGIVFCFQSTKVMVLHLAEGRHIFLATLSGNLYGQGSIIILGLLTNPTIVGYYSLAQKLAGAVVSMFQVLTQTVMPYLFKLKEEGTDVFLAFSKKIILYVGLVNLLVLSFLLLVSDTIFYLVSGQNEEIGTYSFSFWLIISMITIFNVLLNPIAIALKQEKLLSLGYLFVGVSFLGFGYVLTYLYSYQGMLYSMLLVETTIFLLSIIAIKYGINGAKTKIKGL